MKFHRDLPEETKEYLEKQYKEYLKIRPMTKKEQHAVREWVKDGNSVYDNPDGAWQDGMVPVEFLEIYRDHEYIRQHTKGMSEGEARRFALAYYGWEENPNMKKDVEGEFMEKDFEDFVLDNKEMPFD